MTKLAEEPATPPDLLSAVRKQASAYQEVLVHYPDGLTYSDPSLESVGDTSNEATDTIRRFCK